MRNLKHLFTPLVALSLLAAVDLNGVLTLARTTRNRELRELLDSVKLTRDITYATVDGIELKLDVYEPKERGDEAMPILVFIHGGGWRTGDKLGGARFMPAVVNAGYIGFSINYRLTDVAKFPAQIHDCKSAIRWIRKNAKKFGADPNRIGVFGTSAGGHLSALLGTSGGIKALEGNIGVTGVPSDVQAVCDWFGPADLTAITRNTFDPNNAVPKLLGGYPEEKPELARLASPISFVDANDPPFLIIHGTEDPLVPIEQSRQLYRKLKNAGVPAELIEVPGGKHGNFLRFGQESRNLIAKMIEFFDRHLKELK